MELLRLPLAGRAAWIPRAAGIILLVGLALSLGSCRPADRDGGKTRGRSGPGVPAHTRDRAVAGAPHIILINLDDADRELVEHDVLNPSTEPRYPAIHRLIREGRRFSNCHTAVPICGPSRACLLTGRYASCNGMRCNNPDSELSRGVGGGYGLYRGHQAGGGEPLPWSRNDLPVWMQRAGYRTIHVGKYLHDGFEPQPGEDWNAVFPFGWDDLYATLSGRYFGAMYCRNGEFSVLNPGDMKDYPVFYRTCVEGIDARRLLERHFASDNRPVFLSLAPYAPHVEEWVERCLEENRPGHGMVEPQYKDLWPDLPLPPAAGFDEPDNRDKPSTIRQLARLSAEGDSPVDNDTLRLRLEYRRRVLALRSVDDQIGELLELLERSDVLQDTVIVLTSDHGFEVGHHRHFGKSVPYQRVTNVPLIVWGPGRFAPRGEPLPHLLSQIDLVPTLLELAGAPVEPGLQGKSFLPLLQGEGEGLPADWRPEGVLIEHWEHVPDRQFKLDTTFASLRLYDSVYTQWSNGDREYYDLATDPCELDNAVDGLSEDVRAGLDEKLGRLRQSMPRPACFIERPFTSNTVFLRQARLCGLAEAPGPVRAVRLVISDLTDGSQARFWNGSGWQRERISLAAELEAPGGLVSDWSYVFSPPGGQSLSRYRVAAWTIGQSGPGDSTPVFKDFSIDAEQPVTEVTAPVAERVVKFVEGFDIRGLAQDEHGIRNVRLALINPQTGLHWNGKAWQRGLIWLGTDLKRPRPGEVAWSYRFRPDAGEGTVRVDIQTVTTDGRREYNQRALRVNWDE
jgi:arylsulfatase A-like enzyme